MLGLFHSPTRSYIDPWSDNLFHEGTPDLVTLPNSKILNNVPINGVEGGVIMEKFGNETAKYVHHILGMYLSF